jgi:hypothetical protein
MSRRPVAGDAWRSATNWVIFFLAIISCSCLGNGGVTRRLVNPCYSMIPRVQRVEQKYKVNSGLITIDTGMLFRVGPGLKTFNLGVVGSIPTGLTKPFSVFRPAAVRIVFRLNRRNCLRNFTPRPELTGFAG